MTIYAFVQSQMQQSKEGTLLAVNSGSYFLLDLTTTLLRTRQSKSLKTIAFPIPDFDRVINTD
jgi:hypothetical protein